jgi:cadmium resistance protein CadD (predicted permease)
MHDPWSLLGLSVVVFASTNIDDIFVLLGLLSDPKLRIGRAIAGQYLGIGALYAVSVIGSLISLVLAPAYIGLLGIVPILIGLKQLWDLSRGAGDEPDDNSSGSGVLTIALITIANGGDNIGVYTPLFATRSAFDIAAIGIVFAVMTGLWVLAAHWFIRHPTLGAPIRRYGHKVVPFVLIALGIGIMAEAGTLSLASQGRSQIASP